MASYLLFSKTKYYSQDGGRVQAALVILLSYVNKNRTIFWSIKATNNMTHKISK